MFLSQLLPHLFRNLPGKNVVANCSDPETQKPVCFGRTRSRTEPEIRSQRVDHRTTKILLLTKTTILILILTLVLEKKTTYSHGQIY